MTNLLIRPWILALLTSTAISVSAGNLTKVWELRLSDLTGGKIRDPVANVISVSFSPDGRRLAVVVWGGQQHRGEQTLVVVDLNNPRDRVQMLEYDGPAAEAAISWSATGEQIAVPEVFHALGEPPCVLEHTIRTVFYDSNRVADAQPGFPTSDLLFFDTNCTPTGSWEMNGMWTLSDGSAERHLLALANGVRATQIMVVDPVSKRIVNRWPVNKDGTIEPLFADSGKAVCALDGTGRRGVAHCWDVDSGREIAKTGSGNPHTPMATALHARRAVLSNYAWRIYFEGLETEVGDLHRRVVWDFGTGKEIASWKPKDQDDMAHPPLKEPFRFAISPDGSMIAEGGAGVILLYRISVAAP